MFKFISIGKIHQLQLINNKQNFSLIIDGNYTRFINNHGEDTLMNTSNIHALYIGGLPKEISARAVQLWHIREGISFRGNKINKNLFNNYFIKGCIYGIYINNNQINLDNRSKLFSDCEINEVKCKKINL